MGLGSAGLEGSETTTKNDTLKKRLPLAGTVGVGLPPESTRVSMMSGECGNKDDCYD